MKKRGLAGLLALALILALAACGGTEAQEDAAQDQKMEEAAPPQEEETSETDGEDGVPVTIEGPETADDSQQLQEDEPVITVGEIALADEDRDAQAPFGEDTQDESVGEEE